MPTSCTQYERDPVVTDSVDVWYPDGTIILQAENLRFRVHKSILSKHSHVFRDLFSLAVPKGAPVMEGCSILVIHDGKESTEHALKAFYYDHDCPMNICAVAALLEFGEKYDIEPLLEEAESRLCLEFPSTLDGWNKASESWSVIKEQDGIVELATNLIWRHNVSLALPIAMYACSLRPVVEIMDGRRYDSKLVLLSDPDLRARIVVGKDQISRAWSASQFSKWLESDSPHAGCATKSSCLKGRFAIYRAIWDDFSVHTALDPWSEDWDRRLCARCVEVAQDKYEHGRQEIWAKLPEIFKLPEDD
ncbi:hypothetical protein PUNSTDRAFT_130283 [Punctularia strigosozonata HHB-11173 SS5]|uniref:uncharacterized protein n=1 Tax=Punctularia strigosozonata (strain HHB-11173) TaxID=741275 RepID=UPI000441757E|nr:uncharacterized protein PUNSTDRAFT_130283 [Punctularia strigosozonata HHB-11173 SS5]EIN14658.1 hypothetical protein PUNSTDRAFT_130283 [Punctularia strigosozonata HHB-11173 SS5]